MESDRVLLHVFATTHFTNPHLLYFRCFLVLERHFSFLSPVSILKRDIDIAILSVRDVPVSDENDLTYRHSFFHNTVANHQTSSRNSDGVTPAGALNTGGV